MNHCTVLGIGLPGGPTYRLLHFALVCSKSLHYWFIYGQVQYNMYCECAFGTWLTDLRDFDLTVAGAMSMRAGCLLDA